MRQFLVAVTVALTAAFSVTSSVGATIVWNESGDAGKLLSTAQDTAGTGSLVEISGVLDPTSDPADLVDLFRVKAVGGTLEASFSDASALFQLFLFDATGAGVMASESGLAATLTADVTAGTYYLGIALSNFVPQDENLLEMFDFIAGGAPLTTGTLTAWVDAGTSTTDPPFTIGLIGIEPFREAQVPEPATLVLLGAGLLGVAATAIARRR